MGNNQSQALDEEGVPRYNFHERVLRDAQVSYLSVGTNSSDTGQHNEEYFSADESSSHSDTDILERVDPELTSSERWPERSNDEHVNFRGTTREYNQQLRDPVSEVSEEQGNLIDIRPSYHLRSESTADTGRLFNLTSDSAVDPSSKTVIPGQNSEDHSNQLINPSHFRPIKSVVSQTQRHFVPLGKRRTPAESPTVSPRKKMLTRSSTKRKIGYPDTSESEVSEKEDIRSLKKKGRFFLQSHKKSRRTDRRSRDRDLDESKYGKRKYKRRSDDSRSSDSQEETDSSVYWENSSSRHQRRTYSSRRRPKYYSCDDSGDVSEVAAKCVQNCKLNGRTYSEKRKEEINEAEKSSISVQTEENDLVGSPVSYKANRQENLQYETAAEKTMPLSLNNSLNNAVLSETNITSRPCHTLKMGDQSWRNSLGKVFPIRNKELKNKDKISPNRYDVLSQSMCNSNVTEQNNEDSLKSWPSSLTSPPQEGKLPSATYTPGFKFLQESKELSSVTGVTTSGPQLQVSPFKDVVLTPSKPQTSFLSVQNSRSQFKNTYSCSSNEQITDMEVDESLEAANSHISAERLILSPSARRSLNDQQPHLTVADKLKTFWAERKRNFRTNWKSLISKSDSPVRVQQDHKSPIWQSFLSPLSASKLQHRRQNSDFYKHQSSASCPFDTSTTKIGPTPEGINQTTPAQTQASDLRSGVLSDPNAQVPHLVCTVPSSTSCPSSSLDSFVAEYVPFTTPGQVLGSHLAGVDISVVVGEIADQNTAAIVNWTDGALTHQVTSCSRSIVAKAGALMLASCNDYIGMKDANLEAPDVLTTPAGGKLPKSVEALLHVVEPPIIEGDETSNSRALMEVFANCLRFTNERLCLSSISFPLIGAGIFPLPVCVQSFFDAVLIFLTERPGLQGLSNIQLVISDRKTAILAAELMRSRLERVHRQGLDSEALDAFRRHFGHRPAAHKSSSSPSQNDMHLGDESAQNMFTVERVASGRPKLKRPRL